MDTANNIIKIFNNYCETATEHLVYNFYSLDINKFNSVTVDFVKTNLEFNKAFKKHEFISRNDMLLELPTTMKHMPIRLQKSFLTFKVKYRKQGDSKKVKNNLKSETKKMWGWHDIVIEVYNISMGTQNFLLSKTNGRELTKTYNNTRFRVDDNIIRNMASSLSEDKAL